MRRGTLEWPLRSNCEGAIPLLPHDPPRQSILRISYSNVPDIQDTPPHQLLPFQADSGTLLIQRIPDSRQILTRFEFAGVFIQKSLEPVAASAVGAELLGLLDVNGNPNDPFAESDLTALADLAPHDTTTVPIANDPTPPALVG